MKQVRSIILGAAFIMSSVATSYSDELPDMKKSVEMLRLFDSKDWKRSDLDLRDRKLIQDTEAYLQKHHTTLIRIVTKKEEGWNLCAYALARSKNQEVVVLFIRLLRENFYLKEADGSRKEFGFGSKNGCEEEFNQYGTVLASHLGEIGDGRAVPVLKTAIIQGDSEVQKSAYCALFKLGEFSFDEIFGKFKEVFFDESLQATVTNSDAPSSDTLMAIVGDVRVRDPERALELFDRIIAKFPARSSEVAGAHFSKILCYEDLKKYDLALEQCEMALKKGKLTNYTKRIHEVRDRITKRAQHDGADQATTAPESKSEGKEKPKPEGRSQ